MGYKINWNVSDIERQVHRISAEINSTYNDGWTAWRAKKDLLDIKCLVDELVAKSQVFPSQEKEYYEERAKQQTWKILNER